MMQALVRGDLRNSVVRSYENASDLDNVQAYPVLLGLPQKLSVPKIL